MTEILSTTVCALGEGPLWHPERGQLFWFDILGKRLLTRTARQEVHWYFDEHVSAGGWIDHDTLLIASETGLYRFDAGTGERDIVAAIEADNPVTRSNDGRADPWGGFWIGTMGKKFEPGAGSIYRYHAGELRRLFGGLTVSNSIAFAPDRSCAYWSDTRTHRIMRQPLDGDGWPVGASGVFVDLSAEGLYPDGSVVDAGGNLWNAQWGAGRVARYAPDGAFVSAVKIPASQASCPAFGGADLRRLFVTSAAVGVRDETGAGLTYWTDVEATGQAEARIVL